MYQIIKTLLLVIFISQLGNSQNTNLYRIRGIVLDAITQEPLVGANVFVQNYETAGTATDADGAFAIEGLPIGRHQLYTSYLGYKNYVVPIEVKSGKELVISVAMSEDPTAMDEVVVTAQNSKGQAVNAMSYASTRTFSVEESNKFAAAVDDPLRMVQSYAGVVGMEDGNNHISIRGNSPNGLLWRLEGVDIPNPNHYADASSSGGGISALSSQILGNSDFSTGAFGAEYGNALSGVFDLKLRKGNNEQREYTVKLSFLGLEAAVEGPFSKNYKGSYLINYRYSTLSLIDKLGVDLNGVLNYSDLSYNFHLPTRKMGTFSVFGLHGVSSQLVDDVLDTMEMTAIDHYSRGKFESNMSVDGIKHQVTFNKNSYLNTTVAYGKSENILIDETQTVYASHTDFNKSASEVVNDKITFSTNLTQKITPSLVLRAGLLNDVLLYKVRYDEYEKGSANPRNFLNAKDKADLLQGFAQTQWDINSKWTTHAGIHLTHFFFNNSGAIEPRLSIRRNLTSKSNIALAYGLHSQVNSMPVYFVKQAETNEVINKDLGLSKAHHLVLTHQIDISNHMRVRTEMYYQSLFDLPVGSGEDQNYALLNHRFGYPTFALTNDGKGRNYGIETTIEQFLHKDFYYIITASLSDSKYQTKTSEWLNTRYNTRFASVVTLGKEWRMGKNKQNAFGFNIKSTLVGGQHYTPIDLAASIAQQEEVRDASKEFESKTPTYYKLDVGIKYKRNRKKFTSSLSLDLLNATNRKNVGGQDYDQGTQTIKEWYQAPLIPVLAYKLEF